MRVFGRVIDAEEDIPREKTTVHFRRERIENGGASP